MRHILVRTDRKWLPQAAFLAGLWMAALVLRGSAVGAEAAPVASRPGAAQEVATPDGEEDPAEADAAGPHVAPDSEALSWAQPDMSFEAVMRHATAGLSIGDSAQPMVFEAADHDALRGELPQAMARPHASESAATETDAIGKSLDDVGAAGCASPRKPRPATATVVYRGRELSLWIALLIVPGLVAMVVAFGGLLLNRREAEWV